jgi:hypothetical protein
MLVQRAVQEWATTGKKVHIIADKPEKRLAGMWRTAVDKVSAMVGGQLTFEVGCMLMPPNAHHALTCAIIYWASADMAASDATHDKLAALCKPASLGWPGPIIIRQTPFGHQPLMIKTRFV